MLSSLFTIAKKSAPACWRELQNAPVFVLKISKVAKPANNRLKLAARGRPAADARLRTRAAA
jgi:hypothetical protein